LAVKRFACLLLAALVSCNGRPDNHWTGSPQFTYNGIWDVYHDPRLSVLEMTWIRQSVMDHVLLSETTVSSPYNNRAPRWVNSLPWTKPKIYIYGPKRQYLNSPIRIGVKAYADFQEESVHCVMGHKVTLPGLARAVHSLRVGRHDPWEQDAMLNWPLLIANQTTLVTTLERSR
jgi:hypothetical protein